MLSRRLVFAAAALASSRQFLRRSAPRGSSSIGGPTSRSRGATRSARSRIDARVRDQVAEVQVSQTFHNPGSVQIEAEYLFPLPEDGAIQNFVLMVDGRELPGRLLPKDEARRIYEEIVRTKRDPALLEYMGRGPLPHERLPDPAGGRPQGHDAVHPGLQARPRRRRVRPTRSAPRSSPPSRSRRLTLSTPDREPGRRSSRSTARATTSIVSRPGEHEATGRAWNGATSCRRADFRLVYTLAEGALGATVLSYRPTRVGGRLLPPPGQPPGQGRATTSRQPKTVDLRARPLGLDGRQEDRAGRGTPSSSSSNNLRDDDTFNIVAYDDRVETFKPELQRYSLRARATRPSGSSTTSAKGAAPTSTPPSRRPSR